MKFSAEQLRRLKILGVRLHHDFHLDAPKALVRCEAPVSLSGTWRTHCRVGAYTYVRPGARISSWVGRIGRFCSIAPNVTAGDGEHPTDWLSTSGFQWGGLGWMVEGSEQFAELNIFESKAKKTIIGNDVWICEGAKILKGVQIGDGAVIGAGAVVTKDVPPYAIVAGVPARLIRYRFPPEIIARLLALRWWDFKPESMLGVPFSEIDAALDELEKRKRTERLVRLSAEIVVDLTPKGVAERPQELRKTP